jgi:hypothetical protein
MPMPKPSEDNLENLIVGEQPAKKLVKVAKAPPEVKRQLFEMAEKAKES